MPTNDLLPEDPGWYYGSIAPFRERDGQIEWGTLPGIIRGPINSAYNMLTTPGRILSGQETDIPGAARQMTADWAQLGMGLSGGVPAGALGVFAGQRAGSRWLGMAQHMERAGFGPERINAATGWFKGADGEWRKTISDEGARLKTENLEKNQFNSDLVGIPRRWSSESPLTLGDVLEHPKLFDAYPDLEKIPVKPVGVLDSMNGLQGYYSHSTNQLGLGGGRPERLLSTILHEAQHAIQSREGFARGGNVDEFLPEGFRETYGGLKSKWKDFEGEIRDAGANPFEIRLGLARTLRGQDPHNSFQKHWDMLRPDQQERALDLASQIAPLEATQRSAVDSYQRLAGEVESRTVEEQLAQKDWSRLPQQMEGYTSREDQIFKFDQSGAENASIRGFHGTPHVFEPVEGNPFGEFRDSQIGTGEGAQAYGSGHYVAGNPKVAEEYQRNLAGDYQISQGNDGFTAFKRMPHPDPEKDISPTFGSREEAQQWVNSQGSLMEVHILPDEHELLDWDKPLSAQSPAVQSGLARIYEKHPDLQILSPPKMMPEGQYLYRNLAQMLWDKTREGIGGGSAAASAALHEAGIPGIKYLDAGSRGPGFQIDGPSFPSVHGMRFDTEQQALDHISRRIGENVAGGPKIVEVPQTSNYVIFHPSNLRIVGRNGQRLEPIDEDPFK